MDQIGGRWECNDLTRRFVVHKTRNKNIEKKKKGMVYKIAPHSILPGMTW